MIYIPIIKAKKLNTVANTFNTILWPLSLNLVYKHDNIILGADIYARSPIKAINTYNISIVWILINLGVFYSKVFY